MSSASGGLRPPTPWASPLDPTGGLLSPDPLFCGVQKILKLKGSVKEPNISAYFFFPPITQWCSISDVLFTGGRGVSDFSVLKYY